MRRSRSWWSVYLRWCSPYPVESNSGQLSDRYSRAYSPETGLPLVRLSCLGFNLFLDPRQQTYQLIIDIETGAPPNTSRTEQPEFELGSLSASQPQTPSEIGDAERAEWVVELDNRKP
jgi:hypothetical protein